MVYPDLGHPKLKEHLAAVTALMRAAPNWEAFKRSLVRAFPRSNEQAPFGVGDDYKSILREHLRGLKKHIRWNIVVPEFLNWWPAVLGWPAVAASLMLAAAAIVSRHPALLVVSALLAAPFGLYLGGAENLDGRGRARDPTGAIGGSLCPQARMDLSCVVLAGPACGNSRLAGGPDSGVLMRVVTRKTFLTCLLQLYSGP